MNDGVLIIGDPHFCERNNELLDQLICGIEEMKIRPRHIVVLGDMLHNHRRIDLCDIFKCQIFIDRLRAMTDDLIILIGNHDRVSNNYDPKNQHAFFVYKSVPGVRIVDDVTVIEMLGARVLCVPYLPSAEFDARTRDFVQNCDLCIAHQDFKGADYGHMRSEHGNDLPPLPVVSGHIHKFQFVSNVAYIGTPYQTSFAETEAKYIGFLQRVPAERANKTDKWRVGPSGAVIGRWFMSMISVPGVFRRHVRRVAASDVPHQVHNPNDEYQYTVTYTNIDELIRCKYILRQNPRIKASYELLGAETPADPAVSSETAADGTVAQRPTYVNKLRQRTTDAGLVDIFDSVFA